MKIKLIPIEITYGECSACHKVGTLVGHHILYNPPFVIKLCPSCHMKAHSQTNALTVKERWEIGRSLLEEIRKVETEKRFALVKKKASEYGVSYVSLYQYMYFAKYVPDIEKFMEEHPNISWNYVVNDFIRKVKKSGRFLKVIEKI